MYRICTYGTEFVQKTKRTKYEFVMTETVRHFCPWQTEIHVKHEQFQPHLAAALLLAMLVSVFSLVLG